jgi:hypothetical protein
LRVASGVALTLAVVATVSVILHSVNRPPPVVNDETLLDSVRSEVGSFGSGGRCVHQRDALWRCDVPDASGSGGATYRVRVGDGVCWRANSESRSGEAPRSMQGCVS